MLIYGRIRDTGEEISSSLKGIEKGPWFERKDEATARDGEVLVTAELEHGWADWIATRHAFSSGEPTSEIKLFPGAKFKVLRIEK